MLREMQHAPFNPIFWVYCCARIRCASDPDASPEVLLPGLMRELQDRGLGSIPENMVFLTLNAVKFGM